MPKRLTYNEATDLWFAAHPDLAPLRGTWQAITCPVCGFLDETQNMALWACPQCLRLIPQPGHLKPVTAIGGNALEGWAQIIAAYQDPAPEAPQAPPSATNPQAQPPAPEPLNPRAERLENLNASGAQTFLKAAFDQPKPPGISCRVVVTKRK